MTGYACPGCGEGMERRTLARRAQGTVDIDLCFPCRGVWFDAFESSALAPVAVIELFRAIHDQRGEAARPLGERLGCPECHQSLKLTHDIQRTTRFTYYRCASGHGRFTTFYQFLREKSFVRELSATEVSALRARVAQVRCSSCGAPIDLARDAGCSYCHMPIAVLDADAVRTALAGLAEAERKRHEVDPLAPAQAMLEGQRVARRLAAAEGRWEGFPETHALGLGAGIDLVAAAIDYLMTE